MSPISAVSTIAAATSAAASARALGFGPGFIHIDGAASDVGPVQRCDGLLALFAIGHFHERESARPAGLAVSENAYPVDLSVGLEKLAQLIFNGVEAEVSNENVFQDAPLSANRGVRHQQIESYFARVRKRAESIANPVASARAGLNRSGLISRRGATGAMRAA